MYTWINKQKHSDTEAQPWGGENGVYSPEETREVRELRLTNASAESKRRSSNKNSEGLWWRAGGVTMMQNVTGSSQGERGST